MPKFERHIFVCTNQRPEGHPRGCCNPSGESELHRAFKARIALSGLRSTVRANQAGCLDQCEHGPTVVIYPEGVWYSCATKEDFDEVLQKHLVEGGRVERLMLQPTDKLPKDRVKAAE